MKFVITAGPTREYIDPVRFLSNPSTGKMGFAVARAAAARGHEVVLIAGPVSLKTPKGVTRIDVVSARDMLAAVEQAICSVEQASCPVERASCPFKSESCDSSARNGQDARSTVFISTAAVADWRPAACATSKLKKHQMSGVLKLVRNPDILKTLAARAARATRAIKQSNTPNTPNPPSLRLIGFAAETDDVLAEAARKCREKGLELIVANDVGEKGCGFGTDTNRVAFVRPDGSVERLPLMSKLSVARRLVRAIERGQASSEKGPTS